MRLLFINYEFPPQGGGAGFAMLALAEKLAARGHEVDILTGNAADATDPQHSDGVLIHRVRSFRRAVHDVGIAGALSFLASAARELPQLCRRRRYDVLHYYFGIPTGLLSLVPGAHRLRPFVLSLRGSDVPGYDPKLSLLHKLLWPATKRVWRDAYRVVANSEGLRQIALAAGGTQRIEVIRNGIAPVASAPKGRPAGVLKILTVSRLIERKGLDTLIRAVALLRDDPVTVVIAGDGPRRESLGKLARRLGVEDRIVMKGFLPPSALTQEHLDSDVFVLASHSESCSMALLQAMGAGLPVLASRVGGTPELVRHEHNGLLFNAGSEIELAAAIRLILREPARAVKYAAANVALAREEFSWDAVASRYEALFQSAIEASGAASKAPG